MQVTHCQIMINLSQTRSGMENRTQKTLRYKRGLNSRNKQDGDRRDDQQQHHCTNIVIPTQRKFMAKRGQNTYEPAIRIASWIVFESVARETTNGFSRHRNQKPRHMAGVIVFGSHPTGLYAAYAVGRPCSLSDREQSSDAGSKLQFAPRCPISLSVQRYPATTGY